MEKTKDKMSSEVVKKPAKQKRLGPAPIASFDHDIADEMESTSPPESHLPEIKEHPPPSTSQSKSRPSPLSTFTSNTTTITNTITTTTTVVASLHTPTTPRIDISRASSSSHHDSRDSSPENVFDQVGTGTLVEAGLGFKEEGAADLRTSTEELYFMEPDKGEKLEECEKPQPPQCRSPVIFKFDDQQLMLQQHQRKDSASSEVAGLLCISGRSSRISSVGSQGSAVSRLSAISGVSRSPSPHKMLVETSFCGPKPLQEGGESTSSETAAAEMLEQVILSRKHDPTKVVLAEGIKVDTSTPKRKVVPPMEDIISNGKSEVVTFRTPEVTITKPSASTSRAKVATKTDPSKVVVGTTPSGTEYYRINLKPSHLYKDHGVGTNERIIDEKELSKKPVSLNLSRESRKNEPRAIQSASPKPARHVALTRDTGSRSPSPAMLNVSRKSSFCSLFKSNKDNASPDSPTTRERSRSRSKSRDNESLATPNKQKSVLAIFKPKRSGSRSKCSSPFEPEREEPPAPVSRSVTPSFRPPGKEHLRYYDTPLDGSSIHIPLHTPPEEKDHSRPSTSTSTREAEPPPPPPMPPQPPKGGIKVLPEGPVVLKKTSLTSSTPKPKPVQNLRQRVNEDVTVHVPARSPSEGGDGSEWSMEVHRHSSQESQETVISSSAPEDPTALANSKPKSSSIENGVTSKAMSPVPTPGAPPPTPAVMTNREKRHILFTTKLGSGSEEGLFFTQFSLSKTESLCSQLSEQNSVFNSPTEREPTMQRSDTVIKREDSSSSSSVVMRRKDTNNDKRKPHRDVPIVDEAASATSSSPQQSEQQKKLNKDDPSTRLSRYVDPNEIIVAQKKLEALRTKKREAKRLEDERLAKEAEERQREEQQREEEKLEEEKQKNLQLPEQSSDQRSMGSTDEPGSSGSEKGSEAPSSSVTLPIKNRVARDLEDHESTGLVLQVSFDDELPYIPTTLPEERAQGVKLIPMRERGQIELKTCPLERPRSRTPSDANNLESFTVQGAAEVVAAKRGSIPSTVAEGDKLKISLPKRTNSSKERDRQRSPRRVSNGSNKWADFDQHQLVPDDDDFPPPPPLPPRKSQPWIDFDNIPEKRKPPKRITTLPNKEPALPPPPSERGVVFNYVNPEECQCECHETERESHRLIGGEKESTPSDEAQPLLGGIERDAFAGPSDSRSRPSRSHRRHRRDESGDKHNRPYEMDLTSSTRGGGSNRSSIISQDSYSSPNEAT